ncbi:TetR/AcrR family transcriptional regulator [Curtobacterium sp. MCSS17_011]|uniref:TetR/AcrR family transcriptional regulator n=1 Tax=Curtobacterium sp. MCSS17_011 TaxID=2175643 RepID=UPI000D8B8DE4|nr:TetR family transcriptional regulator [Curtobacterium sp. MCSS17_011]PYY56534.1 TetR/AcrR family transcriptional regulator [Curtobacterium sp. MCSS17_011]
MAGPLPLVERKQHAARQRIMRAATDLFAERGFDSVSVADIADRAEVGRTTFFRHFSDKQEVVFAREQALFDALTRENLGSVPADHRSASDAVRALQPLVLQMSAHIVEDAEEYRRHERLVESSIVLRGRSATKAQLIAERLVALLVEAGWDEGVAVFAGQIALACTATGRATAPRPEDLVEATRTAFEQALRLGAAQ